MTSRDLYTANVRALSRLPLPAAPSADKGSLLIARPVHVANKPSCTWDAPKDTHSTRSKWVSVKVQMSCSIYKGSAHSLWDKTANFSHVRNTMPTWGLITLRATNLLKENRGKRGKGNIFPTGLIYSMFSACMLCGHQAWGWYYMLPTVLPTRKKNLGTSLRVMWKIRHTIPNCAQVCTELFIGHLNCREVAI